MPPRGFHAQDGHELGDGGPSAQSRPCRTLGTSRRGLQPADVQAGGSSLLATLHAALTTHVRQRAASRPVAVVRSMSAISRPSSP